MVDETSDQGGEEHEKETESLEGSCATPSTNANANAAEIRTPRSDGRTLVGGSGPRDLILEMTISALSKEVGK